MTLHYDDCKDLLASARNKEAGKPLADNTRLYMRTGYFAVMFHKTEIVKVFPGDVYELNSGGWHTVTTKARINDYAPVNLFTKLGVWYLNSTVVFTDHMKVDKNGQPLGKFKTVEKTEEKRKKLDKAIKKYVDGFIDHLKEKGVSRDIAGDCLCCGTLAGAYGDDMGHLTQHMKEEYYVTSLLMNAVTEKVCGLGRTWGQAMDDEQRRKSVAFRWGMIEGGDLDEARAALRTFFTRRKSKLLEAFHG